MKNIEFRLSFNAKVNGVELQCEREMTLPFVPQIGMGFRLPGPYREHIVVSVFWIDDEDDKYLEVFCGSITHHSSLDSTDGIESHLIADGWTVSRLGMQTFTKE